MKKIIYDKYILKNRAFTLVELLAVIIILGIISAIAIPKVLNTVNKTKRQALLISADNYVRAVDQQLLAEETNKVVEDGTYEIGSNGSVCYNNNCIQIKFNGKPPKMGTLIIENSKVKKALNLQYIQNKDMIYISKLKGEESKIEEEYIPAVEIVEGMTPVKYDGSNWKVVSIADNWYDYAKQEWANAVILKTGVTKNIGDTVDVSSEVKGMFVYIPRYGYKIDGTYGKGGTSQTSPGEIEVMFLSKNQRLLTNSEYKEHPAFEFGSEQLNGIWVGKFETSAEKGSTCNAICNTDNCNNINQEPYIIPNVISLRNQSVGMQFVTAQKFNSYITNGDSHMMKNSEWGAVVYLSQSKYGKYGNSNYSGAEKEIRINNCSSFITGIGADSQDASRSTETCTTNTYETEKGMTASTTGNITGVYDMSGGSLEYVMGNYNNLILNSEFSEMPNAKYYDLYTSTVSSTACNGENCYGHAFLETYKWNNDGAGFGNESYSWTFRGGNFTHTTSAGIFYYGFGSGVSFSDRTFRIVIS